MDVQNIKPGSLFGIPLSALPPGMRWNSTRDMLHEVMSDLHRGWVQEFLFGQEFDDDARILSSQTHLSKSFAFTFTEHLDVLSERCASSYDLTCTNLCVPAFEKDDMSAAISVESQPDQSIPFLLFPRAHRFLRCVRNDRTGVICTVSLDHERGVMEACFFSMGSLYNAWHLLVSFEAAAFEKAFTPGSVNFDILESSIMNMGAGYTAVGSGAITCQQPADVQCGGAPLSLSRLPVQKGSPMEFIAIGESQYKSVLSEFKGGLLMRARPVFARTTRNFGAADSVIDRLVRWGMVDRLSRSQPVVPAVIPIAFENFDECDAAETLASSGNEASADDVDKVLFGKLCDVLAESEQILSLEGFPENKDVCPQNSTACRIEDLSIASSHILTMAVQDNQRLPVKGPSLYKDLNRAALRIAPTPTALMNGTEMPVASASFLEEMEIKRLSKLEDRKKRKREAAARSNAKRSERRRNARLAREKMITSCQTVT